jgi:predicted DCC family thiol-disulfide oxidoreductase YuxK
MVVSGTQGSSEATGAHLVLYDGVCALCNGLVQFLLVHDRRRLFKFASLQSVRGRTVVAESGGNPDELNSFYVVKDYRTAHPQAFVRSRAALFMVGQLGWPWKLLRVAGVLPTFVLDRAYDAIARSRYRVFGRYDQCLLPRPEFRDRFVD